MADYKFSPISPKSPDHDYFPKLIFRRSTASTSLPPSPVSEKAAGKARAQPSTPLIQSHTHTSISPTFPSPSQPQNTAGPNSQSYQYQPTIQEDEEAQHHQDRTLLSDVPLTTPYAYSPEIQTASQTSQADYEARMARARKLQKIDKYIGYTLGVISLGLALIMDVILAYVLHKFYTTKDIPAPGRVGPWAVGTELWPAYMLLAASSVTFLIDGSTLVAACCVLRSSRERKGKRDSKGEKEVGEEEESSEVVVVAARAESALVKCGYVAFVAKWFIIATLYRTGKTTKDLWGWSCDSRAANIQKYYVNDLNFATLCRVQVSVDKSSATTKFKRGGKM